MSFYQSAVFPLLAQVEAERAHDWTIWLLEKAQSLSLGRWLIRSIAGETPGKEINIGGLVFPNQLGVAAGFDKDARVAPGLSLLGFGHIEVGTITPRPQSGNPKPRIFRLRADRAIINRMGFPNHGSFQIADHLAREHNRPVGAILGVSIGKQKETPIEDAAEDYLEVLRRVHHLADYLAINISSPNTPGLRHLQHKSYLSDLLRPLAAEKNRLSSDRSGRPLPLFVKIAPDVSLAELDSILDVLLAEEVGAVIAVNTTINRADLLDRKAGEEGGLSGRPLAGRSDEVIAHIHKVTNGTLPIIGVGGVFNSDDVLRKLDAGASLVQIYTGLIYEGPGIAGRILRTIQG